MHFKLKKYYIWLMLALVSALSLTLILEVSATTVNVLDGQVSIADTANSNKVNNGEVTITVKGSLLSKKTNTITITNETDKVAQLSFDYVADKASAFTIAGANASASGSYSVLLQAAGCVELKITSNSGFSNLTATLVLSNFSLVEAATSSNVTIEYDDTFGSVTVNGTAVDAGTTQEVGLANGVVLKATPVSGARFLGWIDATGRICSKDASYTLTPAADMTVEAVFVGEGSKPWFMLGAATRKSVSSGLLGLSKIYYYTVGGELLFDDLNEAATAAVDSNQKTIILMNDGTLPAGNYTIPAGVTLLIPFDSDNTLFTTQVLNTGTYTEPTAYRTLTMADGANLVINGAMSLSAKQRYAQGSKNDGGSPTGPVSFVQMQGDSNITVNNGGALYAYGYITGSGSVTANSGATVFEMFQFSDFRGGTQSTDMDNGVFPLSQYYVQNIEVPLTLYKGAIEYASTAIYMSNTDFASSVAFIAEFGAMFNLTDSGYIIKRYDGTTDRLIVEIYGNLSMSSISLKVGTASIDSDGYELPINGNISVYVNDGNITIGQDLALLPGSEIIIGEGASCSLANGINVYVYDADQWGNFVYSKTNVTFGPLIYAPGRTYTRTEADLVDASICINGTFDASSGYLYCTEAGANIYSTGSGTLKLQKGDQTVTHQLVQGTGYTEIPLVTPLLKNADDSIVETLTTEDEENYQYDNGVWKKETEVCEHSYGEWETTLEPTCTTTGSEQRVCSKCGASEINTIEALGHEYSSEKTEATCIENGQIVYTCSVCSESYIEPIEALGHDYETETVEATCTEDGSITYTCSVCGDTYAETIAALGHNEVIDAAVDATCTTPGKTQGKHCSVCNEVLVAQTDIPALGHTEVIDVAVDATCTESGLTEGKHCSVCGTVLIAQQTVAALGHNYESVVTVPTCTENGYTTYTCSVCGDSYTGNEVAATGHSYNIVTIEPTCTTEGYTTYTCACGDSYTDNEVAATGHSYGDWAVSGNFKTSTCDGCGETATRLAGAMNDLYSVQDVLYYNGRFAYFQEAAEIVFKDPQGKNLSNILFVQDSDNVIHLSYEMPSDEIMNVVDFVIWIDGVQTDVFEINFDSYAKEQKGTDYEVVAQAIVDYGNASSTYFGKAELDQVTAEYTTDPSESAGTIGTDHNASSEASFDTYGASFVFDEYIAIKIYLNGNFTFKKDCTYQVGVLFGDITTNELTVSSIGSSCKAYVLYNTLADVNINASDWVGVTSAAATDISTVPVLKDKPGVQINLKSVEYSKRFAIRAYLIERNAQGEETVYYGKQVNYGLANYVSSMCNRDNDTLKNNYKVSNPNAFRQFLIETWNYAVAAEETNWTK